MSSFTTPLELEYIDGRKWKVTQDFAYWLTDNVACTIVVPAGFVTDFASIPRLFWDVLPPTGKYGKAAVIHDYLYVMGGKLPGFAYTFTKADADKIFYDAMIALGVPHVIAVIMYEAVKGFGKGSF
jgi:hypothetical protein